MKKRLMALFLLIGGAACQTPSQKQLASSCNNATDSTCIHQEIAEIRELRRDIQKIRQIRTRQN